MHVLFENLHYVWFAYLCKKQTTLIRKAILPAFSLLLMLVSCSDRPAANQEKIVTVSILPQKFLVESLCGDHFKVRVLLPPGANHETFEPTPGDMAGLEGASLYVSTGLLDFERNWLPRFTGSMKQLTVVNCSKGIELLGGHNHDHGDQKRHEDDDHNTGLDPHIWLSPQAMKLQAIAVTHSLVSSDSTNVQFYISRLEKFNQLVDSTDQEIRKILMNSKGKAFMIFHPALAYFARDYGLEQISIEEEGKEPSASKIQSLIDIARSKNIKCILVSKEFDLRHAEAIAKEINAKVVTFDPMAENWVSNMTELARIISEN